MTNAEILGKLYAEKLLTDAGLKKAVKLGLITAADYKTITGTDYVA